MFRSVLVAGSCLIELSSAFHDIVLVGFKFGSSALVIALLTTIGMAYRVSGSLSGRNLPHTLPEQLTARD